MDGMECVGELTHDVTIILASYTIAEWRKHKTQETEH